MLRGQFKDKNVRSRVDQLMLKIFFIFGKFPAQIGADTKRFFMIFDRTDPSENDHASDIERPFSLVSVPFVHHAVAYLFAGADGVQLMSFSGTVKIDFSVLFTVVMIHRHAVRIAVLTQY